MKKVNMYSSNDVFWDDHLLRRRPLDQVESMARQHQITFWKTQEDAIRNPMAVYAGIQTANLVFGNI